MDDADVKALLIIGVFFGVVVVGIVAMFLLIGATTPDQSHLSKQVELTVLSATEGTRNSSVSRYGFRVQYTYEFDGTTYVSEEFVPLKNWEPGQPLRACLDPESPRPTPCSSALGRTAAAMPAPSRPPRHSRAGKQTWPQR